ncbi:copper transporter 3-like [Vitis riparia]|uniref:copper transporter 3-like n=1 Tax=Vitis riparia TaxID=96939 RepID=UPI00155A6DEE|nr:copper transporter 3-like [Vitis riparia]
MAQHGGFWFGADVDILFAGWPSGHGHFHFYMALVLVFMLSMCAQMYAMTPMTSPKMVPKSLIQHAALHCFRTFINFLVLLCVITFNLGVLITVLLGHVGGYVALTMYIHYHFPAPVADAPANDEKA